MTRNFLCMLLVLSACAACRPGDTPRRPPSTPPKPVTYVPAAAYFDVLVSDLLLFDEDAPAEAPLALF